MITTDTGITASNEQREYGNKIDFTCLNIGAVETSLNRVKMPLKVSADEFVNSSINYLGKYGFTTGHIKHELLNILFWEIPFVKESISLLLHRKFQLSPYNIYQFFQ